MSFLCGGFLVFVLGIVLAAGDDAKSEMTVDTSSGLRATALVESKAGLRPLCLLGK